MYKTHAHIIFQSFPCIPNRLVPVSTPRHSVSFSSPSHPPIETKLVDEILYYADVSCEVAFIMPSLLPRYQKFRCIAEQLESFKEEVEPMPRRRTRSGSTGSLEGSSIGSQLDIKSKISRQASEGMTIHEVYRKKEEEINAPFARCRHFTTTTRILYVFPFIFKFGNPSEVYKTKAHICTRKQNPEGFVS